MTGADGFLGWHLRCALRALGRDEVVPINRNVMANPDMLDLSLSGSDAVFHLAGVNRAPNDDLLSANIRLAERLTEALDRVGIRPVVINANSIQAGRPSPFGQSKLLAAEHLTTWGRTAGAVVADVRLPNLFGEHGRPHYNSVVATFCYELAHGGKPKIAVDREVPLLHVQDAADQMLRLANERSAGVFELQGSPMSVSSLMGKLTSFHDLYLTGEVPNIDVAFDRALFNTYRSFCFPEHYPIYPTQRSDKRGDLYECLKSHGGRSLVFYSTSRSGATRGEHYHLRKVERFMVLRGKAVIALRRLLDNAIIRFPVEGATPALVDMPTMWVHSITNVGDDELLTLFWADEMLDPDRPDTYPESVALAEAAA